MIRHTIECRDRVLHVQIELDLGEALAHLTTANPEPLPHITCTWGRYEQEVRDYCARVSAEVLDTIVTLSTEPEYGEVKWFDESKGYGFIRSVDQTEVFVHWRGIDGDGFKTLESGQRVRFVRRQGARSEEAIHVRPADTIDGSAKPIG